MLPGLQRLRLGASTGAPGDKYRRADAAASREPDRGSVQRRRVTQRVTQRDKERELRAAQDAMARGLSLVEYQDEPVHPEFARLFFNPPGERTDPDDPVLKMAEQTVRNISDKVARDAYDAAQDAADDLATLGFLNELFKAINSWEGEMDRKPGVNTEPNAELDSMMVRLGVETENLLKSLHEKLWLLEGLWVPPYGVPGVDEELFQKYDPSSRILYGGFWVPGKPGMVMTSRGRWIPAEPEAVTMNRLRKESKNYPPHFQERTNPWTVETMHDAFREVISREGPYIRGVDLAKEIVLETEVQNALGEDGAVYEVTLVRYSFPNLEYRQALRLEEWMEPKFGKVARDQAPMAINPAHTEYLAYLFGLPFTQVFMPIVYPAFTTMAFKPPPYPAPRILRSEYYKEWASGEYVPSMHYMITDNWEHVKTRGKSALSLVDFWGSTLEPAVFQDDQGRYTIDKSPRTPYWVVTGYSYWRIYQDFEEQEAR